jgi:drug/metabolite transporter (DMT)-like permease
MKAKNFFGNKAVSILLALLCVTLWGTAFPVIKKCYEIFNISSVDYGSKILFAGERFFIAGVMVLIVGIIMERTLPYPKKSDIIPITIMGFFQIFLQYLFSYIGLSNTTGTKTSVITALGSFLAVLSAPLFFKGDPLTIKKIFGCILGLCGVIFINLNGLMEGTFTFFGEGFVILSTLASTAGSVYSKKVCKGRSPSTVSAYHLLIGGLGLIIVGIIFNGHIALDSSVKILLLLYLAFISAVSFTVWTALLKYNPVSRILIFNLLIPIFGTIWSGILLGEQVVSLENAISVFLIALGIILVNLKGRKNEN